MRERTGRRGTEEPHHWHRRLLRARRERPCDRRTGEQRDELTALHAQQHDGSSCRSLLASDQKGSTSRCGRTLLHCGISIPAMSVEGQRRRSARPPHALPRVPSTPASGPFGARQRRLLSAISRHVQCSKFVLYSITSSARASMVGGILRPIAFAVLRLNVSMYLVGCCTGRSLGFSPRRIRLTYSADFRKLSSKSKA